MKWVSIGTFCLSTTLVAVLAFGSLVHAWVPHEHSQHGTDITHVAVRDDHQKQLDADLLSTRELVPVYATTDPVVITIETHELASKTYSQLAHALARGILAYRSFG